MHSGFAVRTTPATLFRTPDDFPHFLKTGVVPCRFRYFQRILRATAGEPSAIALVDVGCGNGVMAEHCAAAGYTVTGVDSSCERVEAAREHADRMGLPIHYDIAPVEALPYAGATFDVAVCCDIFEHTDNLAQVLSEIARVLRPGGILLFSTVNRTFHSRMVLRVLQQWRWTRITDTFLYDWDHCVTPRELVAHAAPHGLDIRSMTGLASGLSLPAQLRQIRLLHRGEISYAEMGRRYLLRESRTLSVSYMGYAVRSNQ